MIVIFTQGCRGAAFYSEILTMFNESSVHYIQVKEKVQNE